MAAAGAGLEPMPTAKTSRAPRLLPFASLSLWFFPSEINSSGAWERTLCCCSSREDGAPGAGHPPGPCAPTGPEARDTPGARSPLSAKSRTDQGTSWKKSCCWLLKARFFVTALTQVFRLETPSAPLCPAGAADGLLSLQIHVF